MDFFELETFEYYLMESARSMVLVGVKDNPNVFEGPWPKASQILLYELGLFDYSRFTRRWKNMENELTQASSRGMINESR